MAAIPTGPVLVVWRDANFWREASEIPDSDYLVETLGWIIDVAHPWLIIASEKTPDAERAATRITLADVIEVRELAAIQAPWDLPAAS